MPSAIQDFLRDEHRELIGRWAEKIRGSLPTGSALTEEQLRDSLPLFLDEIVEGLADRGGKLVDDKRSALARSHGGQRQHLQLDVAELVREYGLFFECVIEVQAQLGMSLSIEDLMELSKCLFTGAAEAVDEYAVKAEATRRRAEHQHFGFIAHELRNPLGSARLAWETVRRGLNAQGRAVQILGRSLSRLSELIDETLSAVRLAELGSAPVAHLEVIGVETLLAEAVADASADAEIKNVGLQVERGSTRSVRGDHRLLRSALTNIVCNAVKFTHPGGTVVLRSHAEEGRILLEVQDECGGLPPERVEKLFEVFTQANRDRSGFGLGLAIAKQAVEAQGGTLSVKNVPESGCIFVLDLSAAN